MLKRNLIAAAVTGLVLASNAAFANEWAFDDGYWKQSQSTQFKQERTQVADAQSQKEQRDRQLNGYNN